MQDQTTANPPLLDRELAEVLIRYVDAIDLLFVGMINCIRELPQSSTNDDLLRGVTSCIAEIDLAIISPIKKVYPDLDPVSPPG